MLKQIKDLLYVKQLRTEPIKEWALSYDMNKNVLLLLFIA